MRTLYAIDIDLPVPGRIVHELAEGGLEFYSRYETPTGGSAEVKVGWRDLDTATANYEAARASAVKRAPKWAGQIAALPADQQDRSRLWHSKDRRWSVYTNFGPPTWWWPRFSLKKGRLRCGWLRMAVQINWDGR